MSPMQRSIGLRARLATGERVSEVKLCWKAGQVPFRRGVRRHRPARPFAMIFPPIRQAVGAMLRDESDALSSKPLRPSALMADLNGRL